MYKIINLLLGNYTLSPYQQKIRQDFLNFLKTKKPNSNLTWLDPTTWIKRIWVYKCKDFRYGGLDLKKDIITPQIICTWKGINLCHYFPNCGFVLPFVYKDIPVDDYGRILAKKLFESKGWKYGLRSISPPIPAIWIEYLIYNIFSFSEGLPPVGRDLGVAELSMGIPAPYKFEIMINPHGGIEFYIPKKYHDEYCLLHPDWYEFMYGKGTLEMRTFKNYICEKKQKKEVISAILKPQVRHWKVTGYKIKNKDICIPKPAAFEFFETVINNFLKKYPQYKNEVKGWFKALLAIDYVNNIKVPFKKDFENYVKKRAKDIILSFTNFYIKPKLKERTLIYVFVTTEKYKTPLTFHKIFIDFIESNPSKYLPALLYLFDLGAYSYFNIFFRLVGQPAYIKAKFLCSAGLANKHIVKTYHLFDFIYPGEYLAFYAKIAGMSRKKFIQKEIPSYLELTSKIAKLEKEVKPLEKQVSNLYKAYTGKEYVFPLPALGPLWWQRYLNFLIKEKEELPQTIKEIQMYGKELETVKSEVENLKKEFVKEAEELNKLTGKKVIDTAKILPPAVPVTLSIAKQIEYYKNLKNELIKSINMIKEKKSEIIKSRKTLEELKKKTEIRKKKVSELVNKLSTLTGKKPIDISKLILPEPKTFPEKLAYYQKLNEQLSQIEQVLRKELEKVLEKRKIPAVVKEVPEKRKIPAITKEVPIVKEDIFKSIIPILPIAVLGGLMLLQSSQKASE